jgi:hypothetical protein
MGFGTVEKFQMQVAARLIREPLKEFPSQSEAKRARHVLSSLDPGHFELKGIQAAPHQAGPAAEIDDAPHQAFIHGHVRFTGERIARVEASAISTNAYFVTQGFAKGLAQRDAAILDRVMRVYFQVPLATQAQIHHGMLCQQHQHVVEKWNPGLHGRATLPIHFQRQPNAGFVCVSFDLRAALCHIALLSRPGYEKKSQNARRIRRFTGNGYQD